MFLKSGLCRSVLSLAMMLSIKLNREYSLSITVELVDNIISCINQTVGIQLTVNLCQPLYIPSDALPDRGMNDFRSLFWVVMTIERDSSHSSGNTL